MPDWVYNALEALAADMSNGSAMDGIVVVAISLIAWPLLVLAHEAGHALAIRARGLRLNELVVGDVADLTIRRGSFALRLGRMTGGAAFSGYVRFDSRIATPKDVLIIALAGPAADLVALIVLALIALTGWFHGIVDAMLWLLAIANLFTVIGNLIPKERDYGVGKANDARLAQLAWRAMRASRDSDTDWVDPNAATSVAPPAPRSTRPRA